MTLRDTRGDEPGLDEMERLHWQCRRGMLELDELFGRFLDTGYGKLQPEDKSLFIELLREPDPDLYQWLLVDRRYPARYESLIAKIKGSQ